MGVAIIVPPAISPIDFTRQILWRTLVLGTFACIWIHGQINNMSYQGLQSCLVFVQSLTMHRWITRSSSQGASYGWDPGIHATSATAKMDTHTIISVPAKRTRNHAKVEAILRKDGSLTHIPIRHNNTGKVKIVSLSADKISGPCTAMNTISDNCSPINIHIRNNNFKK
jgi:hypothetical protein